MKNFSYIVVCALFLLPLVTRPMEPFRTDQNRPQRLALQELNSTFNALEKTLDHEVFTAKCLQTASYCSGALAGFLISNPTYLSTIGTLFGLALSAGAAKICYDCSQETRKGAAVSRGFLNNYRDRISSTEPSRRVSMPPAYTRTNEPPPYELTLTQNEL
jgi:hypothetical protein